MTSQQDAGRTYEDPAALSNAGDEFHILWAARRALRLLDRSIDVAALYVETVAEVDVPAEGDRLLGVDLTEYFGGPDFDSARLVQISQLKYSTLHPGSPWTAARLGQETRSSGTSTIRRLAQAYKGFESKTRDERVKRLRLRLVSNQPLDATLRRLLKDVGATQLELASTVAQLRRGLDPSESAALTTLHERSGLGSRDFADFIRMLDFEDCGQEARAYQGLTLFQEAGAFLGSGRTQGVVGLVALVAAQALPDRLGHPLVAADVRAALGVLDEEDLFPAPSAFHRPETLIATQAVTSLGDAIRTATGPLVVHGMAGSGKTTSLIGASSLLGEDHFVVFDTFGDGAFADTRRDRHTPFAVLTQLSNQMAAAGLCAFLLSRPQDISALWRAFERRVEGAAAILARQDRLLVLAIDAADNGIVVAKERGDPSVFPGLWQWGIALPTNVRLIVSCRTHRRELLQTPAGVDEFEVRGFDQSDSTVHLRGRYPTASDSESQDFHTASGGNPRVQAYALGASSSSASPIADALARAATTPQEMFEDLFRAAHDVDGVGAHDRLLSLVCLTRPIEIAKIGPVWDEPAEKVLEFLSALQPGIIMESGRLAFRDEDFDTYLRDRFVESEVVSGHERLAGHYLPLANREETAAAVIADHFAGARRTAELVALASEDVPREAIEDPLTRARVRQHRVDLALRAVRGNGVSEDLPRLLTLAAAASRSDSALAELVRRDPELASRFIDPEAVAAVYLRSDRHVWEGARFLHTAAALARDPATFVLATDRLADAEAWIRAELAASDQPRWDLGADDIAAGVEATYWLSGPEEALRWLRRWRPRSLYFEVARHVADRLAPRVSPARVARELTELRVNPMVDALFAASFSRRGLKPDEALLRRGLLYLARAPADLMSRSDFKGWIADVAEAAARAGFAPDVIAPLSKWLPVPSVPVREWDSGADWILALRVRGAMSAAGDGEMPEVAELVEAIPKPKPASGDYDRQRHREWLELMRPILDVRARSLRSELTVDDVIEAIRPALEKLRSETGHRWYRADRRYRNWPVVAASVLHSVPESKELISEVADVVLPLAGSQAPEIWISMAEVLMSDEAWQPAALQLLDRAAKEASTNDLTASERTDLLVQCSRTALDGEPSVAAEYFHAALDAAEGVDDDRALILGLAARVAAAVPGPDAQALAISLRDATDAIRPFVSDSRILPIADVQTALANLDEGTALAAAAVWADEDRFDIESSMQTICRAWVDDDQLRPADVLNLLRLAESPLESKTIVRLLDRLATAGHGSRAELAHLSAEVSHRILRDTRLEERASNAGAITRWAGEKGLSQLAGMQDLATFVQFYQSLPSPTDPSEAGPRGPTLGTATDVPTHGAHDRFERGEYAGLEEHLDVLYSSSYATDAVMECLRSIATAAPIGRRVAFLSTVAGLWRSEHSRLPHTEVIIDVIGEHIRQWRHMPSVAEWVTDGLPGVITDLLPALVRFAPYDVKSLRDATELPGISPNSLSNAILEGVLNSQEIWEPPQYLAVAEVVAGKLDPTGRNRLALWLLERLQAEVDRLPAQVHPPGVPSTLDEALCGFLVALLGHGDKRVRGRATHALIGLATRRGQSFVEKLIAELDGGSAPTFRSTRLPPFVLSAKVWLLFALSHLARTSPHLLRPHASRLADVALDSQLPHAQVRALARRAALTVEASHPGTLTSTVASALTQVNQSQLPRKANRTQPWGDDRRLDESFRFQFDSIDTLPYWYSPLARVFDVGTSDVARRAERWIVDEWGFVDDDWWRDRRELRERDGRSSRPDHGSFPVHEVLRTYLEYHGMQMAAGELIDALPIAKRQWTTDPDPWEDWLQRSLDTDPQLMLAELRSPTPLIAPCFASIVSPLDETLNASYFDQFIGLTGDVTERLVVNGYVSINNRREHQSVYISSALVSPATGMALVGALQTADDPMDWGLPLEGRGGYQEPIDSGAYQLGAWIHVEERDTGDLEEHDPDVRSVRYSLDRPLFTARSSRNLPVARELVANRPQDREWLERWSDERVGAVSEDLRGEGSRLWVRVPELLQMLHRRRRALIIGVKISGYRESRGREPAHVPGQSRVYLLDGDGRLRTLDGDRLLGGTNRSGAWRGR